MTAGRNPFQHESSPPRSSFGEDWKEDSDPLLSSTTVNQNGPRQKSMVGAVIISAVILALVIVLGLGYYGPNLATLNPVVEGKRHNVLVIMTDDQDLLLESMSAMPKVTSLIGDQGVTYTKHYCTVAWCCPSRVNFFTGKAPHNTNVTSIQPPYGGWPKFTQEGHNENYLPVWIREAGIRTYYLGKFLNGYREENMAIPAYPKGWTNSSILVDPYTYRYYESRWTNGYSDDLTTYNDVHMTDVTQQKALEYLDDAASSGEQFFMMVAAVAPHHGHGRNNVFGPPAVQDKYADKYTSRQAPRTENFNPDEPSGASWVYNLEKLTDSDIAYGDEYHQARLGAVAGVDDMVAELIQRLDDHEMLDNTYVIYTSDNGFHIGNHRLKPGKRCPYEEDVNIPLLMRGPEVAKGVVSSLTNSHTDMAPTILQMLGLDQRQDSDGEPIPYTEHSLSTSTKGEMVTVEFWTADQPMMFYSTEQHYNNTYRALRLAGTDYSMYYSVWCTGEREFYDMKADSAQMNNRLGPNPKGNGLMYHGRPESDLFARLDSLLMVTKSCKQDSCREPWSVMFPAGGVHNLQDAMDERYDSYFYNQPRIRFDSCILGYIPEQEGPQELVSFNG